MFISYVFIIFFNSNYISSTSYILIYGYIYVHIHISHTMKHTVEALVKFLFKYQQHGRVKY